MNGMDDMMVRMMGAAMVIWTLVSVLILVVLVLLAAWLFQQVRHHRRSEQGT